MRLIERGFSNSEIALELGITLDGAKFHVGEILAKLEVSSREEAVLAWKARPGALSRNVGWWVAIGVATVASGAVALAIYVLASHGEDDRTLDRPPASAEIVVAALPTPFQCPPARTPTATAPTGASPTPEPISDGPFQIIFFGHGYSQNNIGGALLPAEMVSPAALGPKFGEICYANKRGNRPAQGDTPRDGDIFGDLPVGTHLYTIVGYRPEFRLALELPDGQYLLLEPYFAPSTSGGAAYSDLRGKVTRLDIFNETSGLPAGSISDLREVGELVDRLIAATVIDPPSRAQRDPIILQFALADGTHFSRQFDRPGGIVYPNLAVPPEFGAAIEAAIARGP